MLFCWFHVPKNHLGGAGQLFLSRFLITSSTAGELPASGFGHSQGRPPQAGVWVKAKAKPVFINKKQLGVVLFCFVLFVFARFCISEKLPERHPGLGFLGGLVVDWFPVPTDACEEKFDMEITRNLRTFPSPETTLAGWENYGCQQAVCSGFNMLPTM